MKKSLVLTAVTALLVGALAGAFFTLHATTPVAQAHGQKVIHVIEHAVTDTVQQFHPGKDSRGDVLGFGNPVYDAQDKNVVGHDNGYCVRTTPGVAWECNWTIFLNGGQITVEGPYSPTTIPSMIRCLRLPVVQASTCKHRGKCCCTITLVTQHSTTSPICSRNRTLQKLLSDHRVHG